MKVRLYDSGGDRAKSRLILETLENLYSGKEKISLDEDISIEHSMTQTLDQTWKRYLGAAWEDTHNTLLHTIGNLTLTGYNSNLGRKSFNEKKEILAQSKFALNKYFTNIPEWKQQDIIDRAEYLANKALQIWTSLKDDNNDVTGTKPVSLFVYGEKIEVSTWKDVMIHTFEIVSELDSNFPDKFSSINNRLLALDLLLQN